MHFLETEKNERKQSLFSMLGNSDLPNCQFPHIFLPEDQ